MKVVKCYNLDIQGFCCCGKTQHQTKIANSIQQIPSNINVNTLQGTNCKISHELLTKKKGHTHNYTSLEPVLVNLNSLDTKISGAIDYLHYNTTFFVAATSGIKMKDIFRLIVENYLFLMRYHGYGIVAQHTNLITSFCGSNLSPMLKHKPGLPNKDILVHLYCFM